VIDINPIIGSIGQEIFTAFPKENPGIGFLEICGK
jgi:hypothetical protein